MCLYCSYACTYVCFYVYLRVPCLYTIFMSVCMFPVQVCEKEKLLSERNQLKLCMGELWQNLSYLSQEVSKELQVIQDKPHPAHHMHPRDRSRDPTAATNAISISASIDLTSNPGSPTSEGSFVKSPCPSESEPQCPTPSGLDFGHRGQGSGVEDPESSLEPGSSLGVCSPTVSVDFCQEMTEKCTTEEQPRQDCT